MGEARLDRIERKIDDMAEDFSDLRASVAALVGRLDDYPDVKKRVAGLERFRAWFIGTISVGGVSAGGMTAWLKGFLPHG